MAHRSTAVWRRGLIGLATAGALAGSAGTATAQYYYEEDHPYPPAGIYGYDRGYGGYGYGYGYEEDYRFRPAPRRRAPAAITPDAIGRIAFERYGITRIDRLIRGTDAYIVEGARADGSRQRLVLDAYAGSLVRRQALSALPNANVARTDPREPARPIAPPKPPERPAELKPQASTPAAPPLTAPAAPAPDKPVSTPPVEASAPARESPVTPASPAPPSAGTTDPQNGAPKPRLVNPEDVRAPEWSKPGSPPVASRPPQATTSAPAPAPAAPGAIAPVQGQDSVTAQPKTGVVIPPVQPLE